MVKIYLKQRNAYKWYSSDENYFCGYFICDDVMYRGYDAIGFLNKNLNMDYPADIMSKLNGVFSFIINRENCVAFGCDRLRGLPLFYSIDKDTFYIGDDVCSIYKDVSQKSISKIEYEEYIATELFVTGEKTIIDNIYQVQASEVCLYDKAKKHLDRIEYFKMTHDDFDYNPDRLKSKFWDAYNSVGRNLVKALNGRTAVVPLSGGADSRMVLKLLKEEKYEKVICYTYGKPGNPESDISRKVANEYGYPWIMVPYSKKMWKQLRKEKWVSDYMKYSFAFTSTPHIQDLPAVYHLVKDNLIPKDSVFVPGHSGDLIAGSHITEDFLSDKLEYDNFLTSIKTKFYNEKKCSNGLEDKIASFFDYGQGNNEDLASQSEWFNIKERQAKFIVNSVRVYDFFGYEWLIPLWDNALFSYWRNVPIRLRFKRQLYFYAVDDRLPSTNDITVVKNVGSNIRKIPVVKSIARRFKRILNWHSSPLLMEHFFTGKEYFRALILERPGFQMATLLGNRIIKGLRDNKLYEKK